MEMKSEKWKRCARAAMTYACGSLAARAKCSPRAAIRVRIIGCACGMFSACRNARADHWLRVRNVLRVPQYACGSLAVQCRKFVFRPIYRPENKLTATPGAASLFSGRGLRAACLFSGRGMCRMFVFRPVYRPENKLAAPRSQ